MITLIVVFVVAVAVSYAMAFPQQLLARRWGFVDVPDERRQHAGIRPRLGGPAMLLAFVIAVSIAGIPWDGKLLAVTGAAAVLVLFGAIDDKRQPSGRELNPAIQFAAQIAGGAVAVLAGVMIVDVRNPAADAPFGGLLHLPLWAAVLFTLFWVTGMMNTVNFLDGMDGLAGAVAAITAGALGLVSWRLGQLDVAVLCVGLAGVACGFLPHNLAGRAFMGTTGAWLLGYMLAVLAIIGGAKLATALLVIGVPVFDVGLLIAIRSLRGRPFWKGDRRHLFHRLLDMGLSERRTLLLYCALSLAFGVYAFAFTSNRSIGLGPKIYGLVLLLAGMSAIVLYVSLRTRKRADAWAQEGGASGASLPGHGSTEPADR